MNTQPTAAKSGAIKTGDAAPDFTLIDQRGQSIHLADLIGTQNIVLYFYPKDNTPACTAEACAFRDSFEVFRKANAQVIGVSDDSAESHAQFAQKNRLPFTLLSDAKGIIRKLYGVPKALGIMAGRTTYIIDKQGIVRHTFNDLMDGPKHVTEALRILQTLD